MRKIVWAFDPWQDPRVAKSLIEEMRMWAKCLDCTVQPVAVLPLVLEWEITQKWQRELKASLSDVVAKYIAKTRTKDFLEPVQIYVESLSTRKSALDLIKYAENVKADFIFCNTRAKYRFNPFRLGSFAETLVSASRIPVLLMNPRSKPSSRIKSVLFPTDFSRESKVALDYLKPLVTEMDSKIILCNKVEMPTIYSPEFSVAMGAVALPELIDDMVKQRCRKALSWAKKMQSEGVRTEVSVEEQKLAISDDLLKQAKKSKVDLIALLSRSGQVQQAIIGSTARDLLMNAECPVLIFYRPKPLRKSRQKKTELKRKGPVSFKDMTLPAVVAGVGL